MPKPASNPIARPAERLQAPIPQAAWRAGLVVVAACVLLPGAAHAERADHTRPIQADADRLTLDNAQKTSTFDGNVLVTQGTLRITADRVVLHEERDGSHHATATGHQATFRQKRDDVEEYVDGSADRLEYDGRNDRIELYGRSVLHRGADEIRGEFISYDTRTQFFRVNGAASTNGGPSTTGGRVHVTIQPAGTGEGDRPGTPLNLKHDPGTAGASRP